MLDSERTLKIKVSSRWTVFEAAVTSAANVTKLTKTILKSSYKVLQESPCLISCMVFEKIYFSRYILLIDQISLPACLYFVRYWAICIL